jgi:uncharacterized protein YjbI with pentapeptide repeats
MPSKKPESGTTDNLPPLKFPGKTFAFATKPGCWWPDSGFPVLIEAEGGKMVEDVTASLDYLLVREPCPRGKWAAEKRADQLNKKYGAHIEVLDHAAFFHLLAPDREEAIALLLGGDKATERWNFLQRDPERGSSRGVPMPSLAGADFRGTRLSGAFLWGTNLDGADFRDAEVSQVSFGSMANGRFEQARLSATSFGDLTECSFAGATLTGGHLRSLKSVDFSGARLEEVHASRDTFTQTRFRKAILCKVQFKEIEFADTDFTAVDLAEAQLTHCKLKGADLAAVCLDRARLEHCDLSVANLSKASLVGAELMHTLFAAADLRQADLRGTTLTGADFRGAKLDGANFEGANTGSAKFDPDAAKKAKGLDPASGGGGQVGPHLTALKDVAGKCGWFESRAVIELADARIVMQARAGKKGNSWTSWDRYRISGKDHSPGSEGAVDEGLVAMANRWPGGRFWLGSVVLEHKNAPKSKDLEALTLTGWCEAFGLELPDAAGLARERQAYADHCRQLCDEFLADLRGGPKGLERWNARSQSGELAYFATDYSGADLTGLNLAEARFHQVVFPRARCAGAVLRKARIDRCQFDGATFRGANLHEASVYGTQLEGVDFREATLTGCGFSGCHGFRGADFRKANLERAEFSNCSIEGADLSTANLAGVTFFNCWYDEHTRFPPNFPLAKELVWKGSGPPPAPGLDKLGDPADFPTFLKRLELLTDAGRTQKALAMLKADRFQLFAEVAPDQLVGVVKSQTDPELVYSCRLAADGSFACCTHKLNRCGGLREGICKHTLVLIAGLVKAGKLKPKTVEAWVQASRGHSDTLDKDAMSETLIRYKGAEAGDNDWRPTETIPEDYYAL